MDVVRFCEFNEQFVGSNNTNDASMNSLLKSKLIQFSQRNKNVFDVEYQLGTDYIAFAETSSKLLQHTKGDYQLMALVCDCLRICFRERRLFVDLLKNPELFEKILTVAEIDLGMESAEESTIIHDNDVSEDPLTRNYLSNREDAIELSIRCLTNALNREKDDGQSDDMNIVTLFINDKVNGIQRLFQIMTSIMTLICNNSDMKKMEKLMDILYHSIRLLYMLVSQSNHTIIEAIDKLAQGFAVLIKYHSIICYFLLHSQSPHETSVSLRPISKTYVVLCKLLYALQIYSYPFTTTSSSQTQGSIVKQVDDDDVNVTNIMDIKLIDKNKQPSESKLYTSSSSSSSSSKSLLLSYLNDHSLTDTSEKCLNMLDTSLFEVLSFKNDVLLADNSNTNTTMTTTLAANTTTATNTTTMTTSTSASSSNTTTMNKSNNNSNNTSDTVANSQLLDECRQQSLQIANLAISQDSVGTKAWCEKFVQHASGSCINMCMQLLENKLNYLASAATESHVITTAAPVSVGDSMAEDDVTIFLSPLLVILLNVSTHNMVGRYKIESLVFPSPIITTCSNSTTTTTTTTTTTRVIEIENKEDEKEIDELAPKDAPYGTLRYKLIKYMTSTNLTIKRLISEFLYELCHEKGDLFIERTGFGNACALLHGKGILENIQAQAAAAKRK